MYTCIESVEAVGPVECDDPVSVTDFGQDNVFVHSVLPLAFLVSHYGQITIDQPFGQLY
jgi:hypothetical protein